MTLVSVILCCYNDGKFVRDALESLYRQTLPSDRYEVVFIDDGSSDVTEKIASEYKLRANFRYYKNRCNIGLVRSCNNALSVALGDYIIRLDADDILAPTILEDMQQPLDLGTTDFVFCDREEVEVDTGETRYIKVGDFDVFRLIAIGTMMRRKLMLDIGGYRDLFWEEYDFYLRYLRHSAKPPYYIPRPLVRYTIRPGAMTADQVKVREGWIEFKKVWSAEEVSPFGVMPEQANVL